MYPLPTGGSVLPGGSGVLFVSLQGGGGRGGEGGEGGGGEIRAVRDSP